MTNEEAIEYIHDMRCDIRNNSNYSITDKENTALNMAIEALKAEPCGDCVSRRAMLDGLASIAKAKARSDAQHALMGRVMFFTEHLPPVTPKQRTGKWINNHTTCECCGWQMIDDVMESPNIVFFPFCPNCGAKMEGESE